LFAAESAGHFFGDEDFIGVGLLFGSLEFGDFCLEGRVFGGQDGRGCDDDVSDGIYGCGFCVGRISGL
jgi:hypothetical protein